MLAELTDILDRRKFEKKIAASLLSVDQIVDGYSALASLVKAMPVPRTAPDPDDDIVLGTAQAAKANLIISGDSHLLSLTTFQNIPIVTVAIAVQQMN